MTSPITIAVRNVAAIEKAELEIEPGKVAWVGGLNESGKSSLLEAVSAALTGHALFRIGKKNQGSELVRDGAKKGHAIVATEGGSSKISWPDCEVESSGSAAPSAASSVYIGMTPFSALDLDLRRNMLIHLLGAKPTRDDLAAALPDARAENVEKLWKRIERDGWDDTHRYLRAKIQTSKAEWKAITGETWGSKKAVDWEPDDLDVTEDVTEDALVNRVAIATTEHERAIGGAAVSNQRAATLRDELIQAEAASATLQEIDAEIRGIEAERADASTVLGSLPAVGSAAKPFPCPHCNGSLILRREGQALAVEKAPTDNPSDEERAEVQKKRLDINAKIADCERRLDAARRRHVETTLLVERVPAIGAELEKIQQQGAVEVDVDRAKDAVDQARQTLELFRTRAQAAAKHGQIERLMAMENATASDGVRLQVLRERLGDFNDRLSHLAQAAKFEPVVVQDTMAIVYRGRPFYLASESGKYRANMIIGSVLAKLSKAPIFMVDRLDILHAPGRGAVLKMLQSLNLPVMVAITTKAADSLPPIQEHGYGWPYWMEAGVLTRVEV